MSSKVLVCQPLLLACLLLGLGCGPKGAKTPAEAQQRLVQAVSTRNPETLWNALDQETRWSWLSIQRAWREAYDITLSNVPEGPERQRLQARFESGAKSENAAQLFAQHLSPTDWDDLARKTSAIGTLVPQWDPSGKAARVTTPTGVLLFHPPQNKHWGWGYAGLAAKAEEIKRIAVIDLENLRKDAADYERAAARGSR